MSTRSYMKRPIDGTSPTATGEVPTWEAMANALRVRLMHTIEHCPVHSIQEAAGLVDAAVELQALYGRGCVYDKQDVASRDTDD